MENKNNDVEEDVQAFVDEGHTKIDQDNHVLYTVYQPTYSKCTIDSMEKYIRGTVYVIKKTTDKDDAIEVADFTFNNMDDMYPRGVQIYQREIPSVKDILKDDTDLEKNGELGTCIWEKYSFDSSEIDVLKMHYKPYRSKCINNNGEINRDELITDYLTKYGILYGIDFDVNDNVKVLISCLGNLIDMTRKSCGDFHADMLHNNVKSDIKEIHSDKIKHNTFSTTFGNPTVKTKATFGYGVKENNGEVNLDHTVLETDINIPID